MPLARTATPTDPLSLCRTWAPAHNCQSSSILPQTLPCLPCLPCRCSGDEWAYEDDLADIGRCLPGLKTLTVNNDIHLDLHGLAPAARRDAHSDPVGGLPRLTDLAIHEGALALDNGTLHLHRAGPRSPPS